MPLKMYSELVDSDQSDLEEEEEEEEEEGPVVEVEEEEEESEEAEETVLPIPQKKQAKSVTKSSSQTMKEIIELEMKQEAKMKKESAKSKKVKKETSPVPEIEISPVVSPNLSENEEMMESDESSEAPEGNETESDSEDPMEDEDSSSNVKTKVTLEYTPPKSVGDSFPHILHFPKAPLPKTCLDNILDEDSMADQTRKLDISVLRAKDARRARHRVVLADTQRMEYVGTNFGPNSIHTNRYVIGVFDKTKRKVRLIDSPHIYTMEQRIKSYDDTEKVVKDEERVRGTRQLVEEFGSKKSKSRMHTGMRNRVNAENNIDQATLEGMSNSLKEKASTTMPLDAIKQGMRSDLPPYDPLGQAFEEIYNFAAIIPSDLKYELLAEAEMILSKSDADLHEAALSDEYPRCVLDHFIGLSSIAAKERQEYACGVMFLIFLVRFKLHFHPRVQRLNDMSKKMSIPMTVLPYLLGIFTAKQSVSSKNDRYVVNSNHSIKLINYIFVTHLILSNYTMKLNQLMKELRLDLKSTRNHAIKVGCTVIGGGKTRTRGGVNDDDDAAISEMNATLTCPLTFTEKSYKRRN